MSQDRSQAEASCPDSEELAALIDGTVAAHDRKRLLQHVEGCPTCFEVFSETARYRVETSERSASVVTFGAPTSGQSAPLHWRKWAFAAAAGLSVLMVGLFLWLALPPVSPVPSGSGAPTVRATDTLDLQQLWPDVDLPRVSVFQPPAIAGFASAAASEAQQMFRRGVYLTDLSLAVHLGDVEGAKAALEQLMRVAGSEDSEWVADFETVRLRLEEQPELLPMVTLVAAGPLATEAANDPQRFGRWAELGRLASGARASAPLVHPSFLRTLDAWIVLAMPAGAGAEGSGFDSAGDPLLVAELQQVRELLASPPTQRADFRRLEKRFETVLLLGGFAG